MLQKILDFFFDLRYNTNSCFGEQVTHNIRRCTQVVEGVGFEITRNVVKLEEVPTAPNPYFTGFL